MRFPRYMIGGRDEWDQLIATVEEDLWNATGVEPPQRATVSWPSPPL
jgi:hypothetical protein